MAEAMALAGLASSIITFIDASVKLASVSKEFYLNCGELPKELSKCQKLTDEFYLWISDLQTFFISTESVNSAYRGGHCFAKCHCQLYG